MFNLAKYFSLALCILVVLSYKQVDAQNACSIADFVLSPGAYTINQQVTNGFCKEWIVGPVNFVKLIIINFAKVDVKCALGDIVRVLHQNRTEVLYDFCNPVTPSTYLITENKYVFLRVSTSSSNLLSILFNLYISEPFNSTTVSATTVSTTTKTTTTSTTSITTVLPSALSCGKPEITPDENGIRIVGGIEVIRNSWPWQAFISDGSFMCGASLINNNWLVTAAHCVESFNAADFKAYLGTHTLSSMEATTQARSIVRVIKYPTYIGRQNQWDNDVALLKLSSPVTYTKQVSPICLPKQGQNVGVEGRIGIVTGWGKTSGSGSTSNVLKQTTIPIVKCSGFSSTNAICAGQSTPLAKDSCGGDSGGPFVLKENTNYVLTGIVSWGGADCLGDGVYTKVSNYIDWINNIVATY